MRRGVGLGAIDRQKLTKERFKTKSDELASDRLKKLNESVELLKGHLQKFAAKHGSEIRENPEFRRAFYSMCASLGVDPLGSYSVAATTSFFGQVFGRNLSNFYAELSVQVIEVCLATRHRNGGIIPLPTLTQLVCKSRGPYLPLITSDDILKTVCMVEKYLGNGFRIIKLPIAALLPPTSESATTTTLNIAKDGHNHEREIFVQCVPGDLTVDHLALLKLVEKKVRKLSQTSQTPYLAIAVSVITEDTDRSSHMNAHLNFDEIINSTGWTSARVKLEGLVWIDNQFYQTEFLGHRRRKSESLYWFLNFFTENM